MGNLEKLFSEYREALAIKRELEIRLREKDLELKENIDGLKAVGYDSVGTSYKIGNPTERQALKINDLDKIKAAIKAIENKVLRVENLLSLLNDDERKIIELKYINKYSWENVSYTTGRSFKTCKNKANKAFKKMNNIITYQVKGE